MRAAANEDRNGLLQHLSATYQTVAIPVQIDYNSALGSYLGSVGTYTQEACGMFLEKQGFYVPM